MWRRSVSFVNARVVAEGRIASSLRFARRTLEIGERPKRSDAVFDLDGAFVLPGLLNAHDHLELNHFGRVKFRNAYENASSWIDDMRPRLRDDPAIVEGRSRPLRDRLLVGGLKNLLSGVTTVSHHNPFYRGLGRDFPVRVVRRYGWAHSFFLEGPSVAKAFRRTPGNAPFLIHLGEGSDEAAGEELSRLRELGCLRENTVLVHGVALTREDWNDVRRAGAGLVWCPSSNKFLLGKTAAIDSFSPSSIALGTDSRLSGARDLLEELREARAASSLSSADLLGMVTVNAARLLKLPEAGRIARGLPADFVIVPPLGPDPASALLKLERNQIRLVVVGGRPLVGAPELAPIFSARGVGPARAAIDGEARILARALARRIRSSSLAEPGLEL